ncbi:YbhB/YbcL family Raf kinase inhibitor-like protein [Asticcacaulis endophyticus]|uniref:Kinase inhibitor n=1 Tax=Asticcacaulis endophyticus TaxID=1395890 RepID=A0A918Q3I6_9CAUL|nr:YbhB/YbcL family Raf kinase inhibitor-like protein [Asticcacaulis endophyticus]GGZ32328.1 kinase inhibitor [Asticcacaulis endophyticus]
MLLKALLLGAFAGAIGTQASAEAFKLSSSTISEGGKLGLAQVFKGFGCEGGNVSPDLSWSNAPQGTKSFAVTVYDPDAPTGSGWWHWNVVNISPSVSSIKSGASATGTLPAGAAQIKNDYGASAFGGACPPPGEVHRYIFTVYALGVDKLDLPKDASNALAGFMIRANAIDQASITAVYNR